MQAAGPVTGSLVAASADGVLELLAAASRLLERPEDFRRALPELADLLVPAWADACAIGLCDERGGMNVVGSRGPQPGDGVLTRRVPHQPIKTRTGSAWSTEVSIDARAESLGFLWMAGSGAERANLAFGLAEELARRIGIAVDSAKAIARELHIAETLQRALLPESLPSSGLVALDAAYRPATGESTVGGDWYDAFELSDGRIGVSIGDVAGHGLSAAVVMGDARQAVRASAFAAQTPSEALMRANRMMRTAPMMVTALFGVFDPRSSTFTYANAGHPPPLVHMPDGHIFMLPSGDFPLGVHEELRPASWTFTLQPGTLLLLYTDGIIEYGRDLAQGERTLFDAVSAEFRELSESPARSIQERIFRTARNNDDVATLTLHVPPRKLEAFECQFSALPFAAPYVRASLAHFLSEQGLDADARFSLITAVGEAVANAVEHAYSGTPGTVHLRVRRDKSSVRVQVEDAGRWRATRKVDEGGRGIPMMRALMDRVEIRTYQARTEIRMQLQTS